MSEGSKAITASVIITGYRHEWGVIPGQGPQEPTVIYDSEEDARRALEELQGAGTIVRRSVITGRRTRDGLTLAA